MKEREKLLQQGKDTHEVDRKLSIVCNASPTPPYVGDPCKCGVDWIPKETV